MKLAFALAVAALGLPCPSEAAPGVVQLTDHAVPDRPLALTLWYPSEAEASDEVGGTAVFVGTPAALAAPAAAGPLPLVVLSHGGLRSAPASGAWLGAALAEAGFLVAEVDGPAPEAGAAALDEIWRRPEDLRRALDRVLGDPEWAARVDPGRVAVVGFALGGTAALALAGAGVDPGRYVGACGDGSAPAADCRWLAAEGVSLGATDVAALARPQRDLRVGAVVAIAPEFLEAALGGPAVPAVPALLVGLGAHDLLPVDGAGVETAVVPDAGIFDGFAACTGAGPAILVAEEGSAALCGASPEARAEAHGRIAAAVAAFLAR